MKYKSKFNLLFQQVMNSLTMNDCVYFKWNSYLPFYLSQKQQTELIQKCFELTKNKLIEANKNGTKITFNYYNPEFYKFIEFKNAVIEKIQQDQFGNDVFTFKDVIYYNRLRDLKNMSNHKDIGIIQNHPWLSMYANPIMIKDIIIEQVSLLLNNTLKKYKAQVDQYDFEKYSNIFEKVPQDINYILNNDFTTDKNMSPALSKKFDLIKKQLLRLLVLTKASSLDVIKRCTKEDLVNEPLLKQFHLKTNSNEVEEALETFTHPQAAYYDGEAILYLKATINVAAGEKLDINRLSCSNFTSFTQYKKGYRNNG